VPTCHYIPHSSEILIHTSHWRTDGIGAIHLLRNFFRALATPRHVEFGGEGKNITPSMDELAGFTIDPTPEADQASTAFAMEYFGNLPTISLPTEANQLPGPTHRSELVLGPKTTATIVAGCKAHNLSIASALHTASILATQSLDPAKSIDKKYTSFGAINYRPYLPSEYSDPSTHPVSVNMLGLPITMTPSTFAETAIQVQKFYKQPLSLEETNFRSIMAPYIRKFTAMAITPPPPDMAIPSEPTLNSVGIVDNFLDKTYGDKIEITKFWLCVEMLTRQLDLYVWTWEGRMVVSGCYNSKFFTDDFTVLFYRKCIEILVKELDLDIGEDWLL